MAQESKKQIPMPVSLFWQFAKIGLFTFGGGLAMLSLIERACVENKQWITHDEMLEVTVLAEATPGPIAVNAATYVGYKKKGFLGAVCATVGVVLPSFLVILAISVFFDRFLEIVWVRHAFCGIKIAVALLITDAGVRLIRKLPKKPLPLLLAGGCFAAMLLTDIFAWSVSSLTLMLAAGAVSAAVFAVRALKEKRGGERP